MNKLRNLLLVAMSAIALASCLALAACGQNPRDSFVGSWDLLKLEIDGGVVEDVLSLKQVTGGVSFDVDKDGTIAMNYYGASYEGTWDLEDDTTMIVSIPELEQQLGGQQLVFTNSDGTLQWSASNVSMTFARGTT